MREHRLGNVIQLVVIRPRITIELFSFHAALGEKDVRPYAATDITILIVVGSMQDHTLNLDAKCVVLGPAQPRLHSVPDEVLSVLADRIHASDTTADLARVPVDNPGTFSPNAFMQRFTIVVAIDEARGIGKTNGLAWRLKEDMKHFKELTMTPAGSEKSNAVIMGRKTWDSIPVKFRPLPGRANMVITRNQEEIPDVWRVSSLDHALNNDFAKSFVIGGGEIYAMAIEHPQCSELIITKVSGTYGCDTFFPPYEDRFQLDSILKLGNEDGIVYQIERWAPRRLTPRFDLTDAA